MNNNKKKLILKGDIDLDTEGHTLNSPCFCNALCYAVEHDVKMADYDNFGYFAEYKKEKIERLMEIYKFKTVIELGTLVGKSAIWMADFNCVERIYCIDYFTININYFTNPQQVAKYKINSHQVCFMQTFLSNCMNHPKKAKKIYFARTSTIQGLMCVASTMKIKEPVLVYIDAGHSYIECYNDLSLSHHLLPNSILVADDYKTHKEVKRAIDDFEKDYGVKVIHD